MAIATLTKAEQKKLAKHKHEIKATRTRPFESPYSFLEVAVYGGGTSVTVECIKCGEVLVELIGGREQEEQPQIKREFIEAILKSNDGLCMDVKAERRLLAMKLTKAINKQLKEMSE